MRSRFSAFATGNLDHIQRTYARKQRQTFDHSSSGATSSGEMSDSIEWVRLEILSRSAGGIEDDVGTVEFAAYYRKDGASLVHRERSNFRREDGLWVYVDGDIAGDLLSGGAGKVGRNQPCPCGSGMKFKKCCGA